MFRNTYELSMTILSVHFNAVRFNFFNSSNTLNMSEDKQCKSLNFSESPIGWRTWRRSWTFLLRSKSISSTTSPISHRRCRCQSVSQSLWYCCQWQRQRQQQQQQPKKALLFSIYVLFKENVDSTEWLFNLCEIAFNNNKKKYFSQR